MPQAGRVARGGAFLFRRRFDINLAPSQPLRCPVAMVESRPLPPAAMSTDARSTLDELLCTALAVGLVLVAILPAARGMGPLCWTPMWLVGMPTVALWALRGFALPVRERVTRVRIVAPTSRRPTPQARRSARMARRAAPRAAA
jgi:hypothetical protein